MQTSLLHTLAACYGWQSYQATVIASGLINHTYKVVTSNGEFVLQQLNTKVFQQPLAIDVNMQLLKNYLRDTHPNYLFVAPIAGINGNTLYRVNDQYFRAFTFVKNSHTISVVNEPQQAYEAAQAFGRFTANCNAIKINQLQETLPNFHNLPMRYLQFLQAVQTGNQDKVAACKTLINRLQRQVNIVKKYQAFISHPDAKIRVTHHDTKISNVLFNQAQETICVIDLDTVMPGYFISDVGDMIRTYTCPVNEEEGDESKIIVRAAYLQAIHQGYYSQMQQYLTPFEQAHFFFAGEVLIYMQALRFLTDYLLNDVYYTIKYSQHNLVRASNQMQLLEVLQQVLITKNV